MPTSSTFDDLILAVAREAFKEKYPIDLRTSADGTTAIATFGQLAFGTTGSDTERFRDQWLYWRRTTGTLSTGGTTTHSLQSGQQFTADALIGMTFVTTGGTGSGQSTTITDNDNTDPCQITTAALTATSTDTTFEIIPFSSTIVPTNRSSKILSTGGLTVATGGVNIAPGVGLAATNAEIVELTDMIFCWDLHPNMIRDNINRLLGNLTYDAFIAATMITDGDMEDSGVSNWTDVTSSTTSKVNLSATNLTIPVRQVLSIAATNGNGKASALVHKPDAFADTKLVHVAVPVELSAGGLEVVLYDVTNTTALKTVSVSQLDAPVVVYFNYTVPASTQDVSVRLLAEGGASLFYAGPVWLWWDGHSRQILDSSSIEKKDDIKRAFKLLRGEQLSTDIYVAGDLEEISFKVESTRRGNRLNVITEPSSYPTLLEVVKKHAELSLDTDTTYADKELIVQGVMADLEMIRAGMASSREDKAEHRALSRQYSDAFYNLRDSDSMFVEVLERDAKRTLVAM